MNPNFFWPKLFPYLKGLEEVFAPGTSWYPVEPSAGMSDLQVTLLVVFLSWVGKSCYQTPETNARNLQILVHPPWLRKIHTELIREALGWGGRPRCTFPPASVSDEKWLQKMTAFGNRILQFSNGLWYAPREEKSNYCKELQVGENKHLLPLQFPAQSVTLQEETGFLTTKVFCFLSDLGIRARKVRRLGARGLTMNRSYHNRWDLLAYLWMSNEWRLAASVQHRFAVCKTDGLEGECLG